MQLVERPVSTPSIKSPPLPVDATCMLNNEGSHGVGEDITILTVLLSSSSYGSNKGHAIVGGSRHSRLCDYRGARDID